MRQHATAHRMVHMVAGAVAVIGMLGITGAVAAQAAPYTAGAEITRLPAKAILTVSKPTAQFVVVKIPVPVGAVCATDLKARTIGQPKSLAVSSAPDCSVAGFAKWTVRANRLTVNRNAVVEFSIMHFGTSHALSTLQVKVNPAAILATPSAAPSPTS